MKKYNQFVLGFVFLISATASAYNVAEHRAMTEIAVERSNLNPSVDPALLADLELNWTGTDFISHNAAFSGSPSAVMSFGAIYEDCNFKETLLLNIYCPYPEPVRVLNHFYDPQWGNFYGRPLTVLGVALGNTSPDWALEDRYEVAMNADGLLPGESQPQKFSYRNAQQYLLAALTQQSAVEPKALVCVGISILGQVVTICKTWGSRSTPERYARYGATGQRTSITPRAGSRLHRY